MSVLHFLLQADGVSHKQMRAGKRRGESGCKSGLQSEEADFMRVYRPSSILMRKDGPFAASQRQANEREVGLVEDGCHRGG